MSKSIIYAVNTTAGTAIAANGVYAPNQIIRRYGPSVELAGNGITIDGAGYYKVDATVSVAAVAAAPITVSLYKDGVLVPGATATAVPAAVGDVVTLPINAVVRVNCNCDQAVLTIVVAQAVTSNNLAVVVDKE